ncbi:cation transporter [Halomicronema hongdechloris C2206]|uniref:Cation transporter n=1 Tax=Halomicronema hongdechloris C2206 TaxID=1641165 RepID=A0A1Z3HNT5_9CYAN|nr:cation diffusion facilitator family transporter [Halomicronema hongdechloris]ASC71963.1 cation transporter [Halomicronema hongdechloris C2206]
MSKEADSRRISYRLLVTILWANLLVLVIEVGAGWASQSLLLLADSLHTLIDSFSTLLSLVAIASPQRPLGREIWGHGRGEVAGTLILTAFLGFTGFSLVWVALRQLYQALQQGSQSFPVQIDLPVLQLMAVLVLLSLTLALYGSHHARSLHSLALGLTTQHSLQDGWLSLVMVAGLAAIWQQQAWVDPMLALVFTGLAVRSLWRVLNAQLPMLLRPTAIAPEAIAQTVAQVEGVTRCVRIRSRGMVGRQVWIQLHLAVHPEFIDMADQVEERAEAALRQRYGPLRTQIWIEPAQAADAYGLPSNIPDGADWSD